LIQPMRRSVLAACLTAATVVAGCQKREAPETVLARSTAEFRRAQIAGLEKEIARVESGELVTKDQLAIGISEDTVEALLNASLPQETVVAGHLRVRIESAQPIFRGSQAALLFRATASSVDAPDASATIELGGALEQFRLEKGTLFAKVSLGHFTVREASVGELAADALDGVVRANLALIQDAIPALEIPVQIEQSIRIGGLTEGAVVARPGSLPLQVSVTQVLPINERLWVLLQAKAGPWQTEPAQAATP
jgi:hypothetical protein